ncbi:MAG: hypothetical protein DHS20C20_24460 [Ardenticatenaceae bacterium]|nr:MAG: hypothetical protein DHS20C20_24460 [Ardenticatenaceae bacterium]
MNSTQWDYCTIVFRTYHNVGGGGDAGISAFNLGLLWFEADAKGPNGRYIAGKSNEVPFAQPAEGYPQKNHPAHVTAYRELAASLKKDGWQPISGGGSGWWEKRFRRHSRKAPRTVAQKIRSYFSMKPSK